jgi:HSP20 family molecular chaperone IbpA
MHLFTTAICSSAQIPDEHHTAGEYLSRKIQKKFSNFELLKIPTMSTGFPKSQSSNPEKFVPSTNKKRNKSKLTGYNKNKQPVPFYTVKELPSLYEVQVKFPGLKRDTFTVYGNEHSLSIDAVTGISTAKTGIIHQDIGMPQNADTQLAIAEYKNDVLYLFVPKTALFSNHTSTKIIVY